MHTENTASFDHFVDMRAVAETRHVGLRSIHGSSADAEIAAHEADHRIKNNLQIVMSLLRQQAGRTDLAAVREALTVAEMRIAAVAELHAALHGRATARDPDAPLDLAAHLRGLGAVLATAFGTADGDCVVEVEADPFMVDPTVARLLGQTVAELVTNALRHAYRPGQAGTVRVTGTLDAGGYVVAVADDGRGLPAGFDLRRPGTGLGLRLVSVLADQAGARVTVARGFGTRFTLRLPSGLPGSPSGLPGSPP